MRNEDSNLAAGKSYAAFKGFGAVHKESGYWNHLPLRRTVACLQTRSAVPCSCLRSAVCRVHPASAGAGVKCWSVSCSGDHLPPLRFLEDADRWSRSTSCCLSVGVSQAVRLEIINMRTLQSRKKSGQPARNCYTAQNRFLIPG